MLFLLNDVILSIDAAELTPPITSDRFAKVSLNYVAKLGAGAVRAPSRCCITRTSRRPSAWPP